MCEDYPCCGHTYDDPCSGEGLRMEDYLANPALLDEPGSPREYDDDIIGICYHFTTTILSDELAECDDCGALVKGDYSD